MEPERIKLLNDRAPDGAGRYVLYWMQAAQRAGVQPRARARGGAGQRARAARGRRLRADGRLPRGQPAPLPLHARGPARDRGRPGAARRPVRPARGAARARWRWRSPPTRRWSSATAATRATSAPGGGRSRTAPAGRWWRSRARWWCRSRPRPDKAEVGARTLRPKILRLREHFLEPLAGAADSRSAADRYHDPRSDLDPADVEGSLAGLELDRSVPPVSRFTGGTSQARERLHRFLRERLPRLQGRAQRPRAPPHHRAQPLPPVRPDLARGDGAGGAWRRRRRTTRTARRSWRS